MPHPAVWSAALLAGAAWGVLFASWLLPVDVPARVAVTALLVLVLAIAGPVGRAAAGGFALGTGVVATLLLARSGVVLGDAPLAPFASVVAGAALTAWSIGSGRERGRPCAGSRRR